MKYCWHSWKIWKEADTKRIPKIATLLSIVFIPLGIFLLTKAESFAGNSWMVGAPGVVIFVLGALLAAFNIPMYLDDSFPKSGPQDRSCLKCGVTQLNATNHLEKIRKVNSDKSAREIKLRREYELILHPPEPKKISKKTIIKNF